MRSRAQRVLLAVVATVAVLLAGVVGASPVAAGPESISVSRVDATGELLTIDVAAPGASSSKGIALRVDGRDVEVQSATPLADAGGHHEVMFVLDTSARLPNGAVQASKDGFLDALAPGQNGVDRAGAVTVGGGAIKRAGLVGTPSQLEQSIGTLAPNGATALWDGIRTAADAFGTPDGSLRHIVVVVGTADDASAAGFTEVVSAVRRAQANLHVLVFEGGDADVESLSTLIRRVGGDARMVVIDSVAESLSAVGERIASTWRITADVGEQKGDTVSTAQLTWDGTGATFGYEPRSVNLGDALLAPAGSGGIDGLLSSDAVKYLVVLLGCAAAGMAVYSVGSLIARRSERLDVALRHYEGYARPSPVDLDDEDEGSLAKGAVMKRAVKITGDLAQRQGLLTRVEGMLEQADLPLRPAEALFFYCAIVVLATAGAAVLFGSPLMVIAVVLAAIVVPRFLVDFRAKRRAKKFATQLPDMLTLLAGTLRAGYSIGQGFEAVSKEIDGPMGRELRRIMAEARLGRPLEEALDAAAERVGSDDFAWAVMAIRIQREVGGNLAELLLTVADTMTQRERLRRDVSSLTAEGRMSAIVLGILPPGLATVMFVMNPEYIAQLFEKTTGMILVGVAVTAMLIGFAWMKKIVSIEI